MPAQTKGGTVKYMLAMYTDPAQISPMTAEDRDMVSANP